MPIAVPGRHRHRAALALAVVVVAVFMPPVAAALCSDPATQDAYTSVLASTDVCENAVGFTLGDTLTKTQTSEICTTCTALAATTKSKALPTCNVRNSEGTLVTIQSVYDGFFACSSSSSTSGSKSSDITPVPSPNASTTPTPKTTNSTSTSPSLTTAPTSSSGSGSSATTKKPSTTTKAPLTTKTSSSTDGSSSSSGSLSQSSQQPVTPHDNNIVVIIGIAGGVVLFVIVIATLCVCRQRRRNRTNKLNEVLISPATIHTQQGSTIPGGNTARSQTGTGGGTNSSAQSVPQGGLWDDEAIVAARIPREKVIIETLLSRGGYGEVYRGVYNGQEVAIKTLLPETRKNMKQINAFLAEVKLMASLEHERIVFFIGVAWDSLTDLCVVAEYMNGGDLRMALTHFEEMGRPHGFDHDKVKIALHISHALTYLHSLQPVVLHRDLKSKNILLDEALNAKLTDFGVSRERSDRTMTAGVGTSLWMAPEVMMGERYNEKSDIFSFGIVLSELDSHSLPYSQVKESESGRRVPDTAVLQMVSMGKLKVQFSPDAHPEIVALANLCVATGVCFCTLPHAFDARVTLQFAVNLVEMERLGGIVSNSDAFITHPELVQIVKKKAATKMSVGGPVTQTVLLTWGDKNTGHEAVQLQKQAAMDGVISDNIGDLVRQDAKLFSKQEQQGKQ